MCTFVYDNVWCVVWVKSGDAHLKFQLVSPRVNYVRVHENRDTSGGVSVCHYVFMNSGWLVGVLHSIWLLWRRSVALATISDHRVADIPEMRKSQTKTQPRKMKMHRIRKFRPIIYRCIV